MRGYRLLRDRTNSWLVRACIWGSETPSASSKSTRPRRAGPAKNLVVRRYLPRVIMFLGWRLKGFVGGEHTPVCMIDLLCYL